MLFRFVVCSKYVDESYQTLMGNTKWDKEAYENSQPASTTSSAGKKSKGDIHDMD